MEIAYFDALERAAEDPEVRVIVVTGAGRGFCAGADLDALQRVGRGESWRTSGKPQTLPTTILKPIIAAINGSCAGLGLVWALMADLRFAAAGAKMTTAFSRRGLVAEHGSSWILPRLIGHARTLDLMFSGRVFQAEEALELGLVDRVVRTELLLHETLAYARELAQHCSPASMAAMKWQIYRHWSLPLDEALAESNALMARSLTTDDFREGVSSFIEKRAPRFAPLAVRPGARPYEDD